MRIAVVSDVHGNLTALEAVLADLRVTAPDLILYGGDLADGCSSPAEVVDLVRELGWPAVVGNADEMLFRPQSLEDFAAASKAPASLWDAIRERASATRAALGEERLAWLAAQPMVQVHGDLVLVHASPGDCWRAPDGGASEEVLEAVYGSLGLPIVAHGHTHLSSIRRLKERLVIETGSVGLPFDGDRRAAYLLLEDGEPSIRRVEYDIEKELKLLAESGFPGSEWTARILQTARPQMP